eukprot:8397107-Pyramimonas_sp.AAC.1
MFRVRMRSARKRRLRTDGGVPLCPSDEKSCDVRGEMGFVSDSYNIRNRRSGRQAGPHGNLPRIVTNRIP